MGPTKIGHNFRKLPPNVNLLLYKMFVYLKKLIRKIFLYDQNNFQSRKLFLKAQS